MSSVQDLIAESSPKKQVSFQLSVGLIEDLSIVCRTNGIAKRDFVEAAIGDAISQLGETVVETGAYEEAE